VRINVKLLGLLEYLAKEGETTVNMNGAATVEDLLLKIAERYGQDFKRSLYDGGIAGNYLITVNGVNVSAAEGLGTSLNDNDEVVIVPVASGG
jgi:MoaD family protein